MISHWGAPQRLEQTCPHFVVVINATLCRTSLIHIVWVCGLVSAVDFAFLRMATDSIGRRRPRFARALRQGPCCGHGCGACVWDVVFRHLTCVPDMSARILG